ncbi:MAG: MlaD family protein [Zoogloea sp.]|uniref:MlaD family protein n=1 Tax=Zoogloea sp. TaxID=49181 RepID=UPI0026056232|nr:MlaD family protein [Zoogloea sp.]MDD2987603.1 MlaD family protein [Zoogloea sp.]
MENRAHAIAAGLFAILLSAAVVLALWWFSDKRETTRDVVLVSAGSVNGLNPQATVRYRGIVAGKVAGISLDPDDPRQVLVRVRIRADLPVTTATRARMATQGVTGLAFIALDDPGTVSQPLTGEGGQAPRIPLGPSLIDEFSDTALQTLRQLRDMTDRLATLTRADNLKRVDDTLANLEAASRGLDRTLQEAPRTLAAVRQAFSKDKLARVDRTLENLERASAEATPMVIEGRKLLVRLQTLSERFDNLAGTAGEGLTGSTLPRFNVLLQELTATSRQLSELLDEIDSSPQMLILGRGRPQPGPGEAGFREPGR